MYWKCPENVLNSSGKCPENVLNIYTQPENFLENRAHCLSTCATDRNAPYSFIRVSSWPVSAGCVSADSLPLGSDILNNVFVGILRRFVWIIWWYQSWFVAKDGNRWPLSVFFCHFLRQKKHTVLNCTHYSLKLYWNCPENVLKMSWKCPEDFCRTCFRTFYCDLLCIFYCHIYDSV